MKNILSKLSKITVIIALLPCFLYLTGCATQGVATFTPGQIDLGKAKGFQRAGRYDLAIETYTLIKNKYPLSKEAVIAELELAETFYLQGSYVEARAGFETFQELHPKHARVDFCGYRIAMTHYKKIPTTNDRDLSSALGAIEAFKKFIAAYPKSKYVSEANNKIRICKTRLAEKEYKIAKFYVKTQKYAAAAGRFRNILKKHRGQGFNESTLFHLGLCYYKLKNEKMAKETLQLFLKQHAKSQYASEAKKMLKEI